MHKKLLIAFALFLILLSTLSIVSADGREYVVEGEENLDSEMDIKEKYNFNGQDYYIVTISGVHTASSNENVYIDSNRVKLHQSKNSQSSQDVKYNIDIINAENTERFKQDYRDIKVAVVDTGISNDHPKINSLEWEFSNRGESPDDNNGHGTHVAGIIASEYDSSSDVRGVAPGVKLYNAKALGRGGSGSVSDLALAIQKSAKGPDGELGTSDDADVISISAGTRADLGILEDAVEAVTPEVTVVSSAGNTGDMTFPAKYDEVIAVGNIDENKEPSFINAPDPSMDVAAPGTNILSTSSSGGFERKSGTSMAAPHVSGLVAVLLSQNEGMGSETVRSTLHQGTEDIHKSGFDKATGHGLIKVPRVLGNNPSPQINKITPSEDKIAIGDEVNIDSNGFGQKQTFSVSVSEDGESSSEFKSLEDSSFKVTKNLLNNFGINTSKSLIENSEWEFKVKTSSGSDTKTKKYSVITEKKSNLELTSFSVSNVVKPYSKQPLDITIANNGLSKGNLEGEIKKGGEVVKKVNREIDPTEETTIGKNLLFEGEGTTKVEFISPQVQNKELNVEVRYLERRILEEFKIMNDEIRVGENAMVKASLNNPSNRELSLRLSFSLEGETKTSTLDIGPQKSKTVQKEFKVQTKGEKEVRLEGQSIGKRFVRFNVLPRQENEKKAVVKEFSLSKNKVEVGEEVEVRAVLSNPVEDLVNINGKIKLTNSQMDPKTFSVEISPGERRVVTKTIEAKSKGQKVVKLMSESIEGDRSIGIQVEEVKNGVAVEGLSFGDQDIVTNNPVTLKIKLKNYDNEYNGYLVSVKIDGENEAFSQGVIKENNQKVVSTKIKFDESGKHNVKADLMEYPNSSKTIQVDVQKDNEKDLKLSLKEIVAIPVDNEGEKPRAGEKVELNILLTNKGNDGASLVGTISTEKERIAKIDTYINPNSAVVVKKVHKFETPGEYSISVNTERLQDKSEIKILPQKDIPKLSIDKFNINPENEIEVGEKVEVDVLVKNNGNDIIPLSGKFTKDSLPQDGFDGEVRAGESKELSFETTFEQSGEHTVGISFNNKDLKEKREITVIKTEPKKLLVGEVSIDEIARVGQETTLSIRIKNPNKQPRQLKGEIKMPYKIKVPIDTTIEGEQTETIEKKIVPNIVGNHRLRIISDEIKEKPNILIRVQPG